MSYALKRRAIPAARDPANRGTLEAMAQAVNELSGTTGQNVDRAVRVGELLEAGVMQLNPAGLLERKTIAESPIEIADIEGLQDALDGKQPLATAWNTGNFDPATKANVAGQTFTGDVAVRANAGTGQVALISGSALSPGYIGFYTADNNRRGYIGWSDGANKLVFAAENGWGYSFLQTPSVGASPVWHGGALRNQADFSGALASRSFFQTSVANGASNVGVLPNGTGTIGLFSAWNSSDPDNAGTMQLRMESTLAVLASSRTGTGVTRPLSFQFEGVERMQLTPAGVLTVNGVQVVRSSDVFLIVKLTQAAYDGLGTKDPNTSYYIVG